VTEQLNCDIQSETNADTNRQFLREGRKRARIYLVDTCICLMGDSFFIVFIFIY
jgi:hypothetical protein